MMMDRPGLGTYSVDYAGTRCPACNGWRGTPPRFLRPDGLILEIRGLDRDQAGQIGAALNGAAEYGYDAAGDHLREEIARLAKVLLEEFGGPTQSESAVDAAIRLLRERRASKTVAQTVVLDLNAEPFKQALDRVAQDIETRAAGWEARLGEMEERLARIGERPVTLNLTPLPPDVGEAMARAIRDGATPEPAKSISEIKDNGL